MLLDTASLYFRAFFGVPDTVRTSEGTPVNAARGLLDMIAKLVTAYEPQRLIACWDDDWRPQWRVELIESYKAHRVVEAAGEAVDVEEVPDPLQVQLPVIRDALAMIGVPIVGIAEHEADDVIGSYASQSSDPVDVITGDRDLFQLVDDARRIRVIYTGRGMSNLQVTTDAVVTARYGILPEQYADFATLRGDPSDGLPGVKGVGEKTAATLLAAHGDLQGVLAAAGRGEGMSASVRAKILDAVDYLAVAPRVVEVVRDLPVPEVEDRIAPLTEVAAIEEFAARWALESPMERVIHAFSSR